MQNYFKGKWDNLEKNHINISKIESFVDSICLYDLGSSGGTPPPFCWIDNLVQIVNFEPDPRASSSNNSTTLPIAIGPKNLSKIYLNRRQTTSSLLKPNHKVLNRYDFSKIFKNEAEIFQTIDTQKVETFGLDEIIELNDLQKPDFLKIDVQGLTHEVLESAYKCLNESVIGLQIEHEFIECYDGQKTFGITHEYLYDIGFEIFKLSNINRWHYKTKDKLKFYSGQQIFCDFIYFKNIDSISKNKNFWNEERAIKTILLLLLYDLTDPAAAYLEKMEAENILNKKTSIKLYELIINWEGAINYLFKTDLMNNLKTYFFLYLNIYLRKFSKLTNKIMTRLNI